MADVRTVAPGPPGRAGLAGLSGRLPGRVALADGVRLVARSATVGLATVAALLLLAAVVPGFALTGRLHGLEPAVGAAVVVSLVNAVIWPVLLRLVIGVVVLTFGLAAFAVNAALVWLGLTLVPGVVLGGPVDALAVTLVASAASAFTAGALPLDRAAADRRSLRRSERRVLGPARQRFLDQVDPAGAVPGVLFLQIDGLSGAALRRAVDAGRMPTVARWLATGSHRLLPWQTGVASQTAASQCGLLFGDNDDVPAFRWLEKETGRFVVANRTDGAEVLQARRSNGRGLLHADGGVCSALVSGDAADSILTMSLAGQRKGHLGNGYGGYFADPAHAVRTAAGFAVEVAREVVQATAQRLRRDGPRVSRGGLYPLIRALTTVVARDVSVQWLVDNLLLGRSVLYADLLGYDEVAHHSGIDRPDSLAVLTDLDRRIARLELVAREVRRPYRFVLLSDHGQSPGEPFADTYGVSLADTVRIACGIRPRDRHARRRVAELESSWAVNAALADARTGAVRDRAAARLLRSELDRESTEADEIDEGVVVLASGGLGLVSFPELPARPASRGGEPAGEPEPGGRQPADERGPRERRAARELIEAEFPELIPALVGHPGVGYVVVADAGGAVVVGPAGERHLAEPGSAGPDRVVGVDPLAGYGPDAAWSLRRAARFAHAPDLLVQGALDPVTGWVTTFEEFAGSHGSLGGEQTDAFVLAPADLPLDPAWVAGRPVPGAEAVHRHFRAWLGALDHAAFGADAVVTDAVVTDAVVTHAAGTNAAMTGAAAVAPG